MTFAPTKARAPRPDEIPPSVIDFAWSFAQANGAARLRAFRRLGPAARCARFVAGLPRVVVPAEEPCLEARSTFAGPLQRRAGLLPTGRLGQSILHFPSIGDYLRGRPRQALRTNVRRATIDGFTVTSLPPAEADETVSAVYGSRGHLPGEMRQMGEEAADTHAMAWVMRRKDGSPCGFESVARAGSWARLLHAASNEHGGSRWLLHLEALRDMAAAGIDVLLVDSAVTLPIGMRYYQSVLGFRVYNVRLPFGWSSEAQGGKADPSCGYATT